KDSFVLREAGRKQTVAGGQVLDTDPPPKPGPDPEGRLAKRQAADRTELAWRLVADRGAVRASDVLVLAGIRADEAVRSGPGTAIRLPDHQASTEGRDDAGRLVAAVAGGEPSPPTVKELVAQGFTLELIKAASADRRLVRISPELVFTPSFVAEAERVVRERG